MTDLKMGDRVTYKGEEWEVGFINQLSLRGTLRLQKSGMSDARQVNRVHPEEVNLLTDEGCDNDYKRTN